MQSRTGLFEVKCFDKNIGLHEYASSHSLTVQKTSCDKTPTETEICNVRYARQYTLHTYPVLGVTSFLC